MNRGKWLFTRRGTEQTSERRRTYPWDLCGFWRGGMRCAGRSAHGTSAPPTAEDALGKMLRGGLHLGGDVGSSNPLGATNIGRQSASTERSSA
jgi:hypothetical protein